VVVAFSGGVDSSVVLAAAMRNRSAATASHAVASAGSASSGAGFSETERQVLAVTARSPSVAEWQQEWAVRIASQLDAAHLFLETDEVSRESYAANDSQRCFHCKATLYETIDVFLQSLPGRLDEHHVWRDSGSDRGPRRSSGRPVVVSGTNADDLGDHRPGIQAGRRAGIETPLADLGIGKQQVREIAAAFGLQNADLAASPCLASRIAYGVRVTADRLARVERAEQLLRSMGLLDVRVRLHADDLARIEVPAESIAMLAEPSTRARITAELARWGFQHVTLDLGGRSSGSMNRALVTIGADRRG